jgi:methionyl-tRNA formyltransferase
VSARERLAFFGSGAFGLPTLARLAAEHDVLAIVTQPDRPAGRGARLTPTPIAEWARRHLPGTPVLSPERVGDPAVIGEIRRLPAAVFVVIAFGQKLPPALLEDRFAINLHASLLPRWRGAAPINHAILAGDDRTGNSVITLARTMDAGLILGHTRRAIDPAHTAGDLHDLLAGDGPALVASVLDAHAAGTLRPVEQDPALVTLAPKLRKEDGWVDFAAPAEACRRRIHGLNPWPGVAASFRGEPIRLWRAEARAAEPEQPAAPGAIVSAERGDVACGGGTVLRLVEVQPPGGRAMPWADFARGRRVRADEMILGGRP